MRKKPGFLFGSVLAALSVSVTLLFFAGCADNPEKTSYSDLLDSCRFLSQEEFTYESWDGFSFAFHLFENAADKEKSAAADALRSAIAGLEKKGDIAALVNALVDTGVSEGLYTPETFALYAAAKAAATDIIVNARVSQSVIDGAAAALDAAYSGLEFKEDVLLILSEMEIIQSLIRSDYTAESWLALAEGVSYAEGVLSGETDDDGISAALDCIRAAISKLERFYAPVFTDKYELSVPRDYAKHNRARLNILKEKIMDSVDAERGGAATDIYLANFDSLPIGEDGYFEGEGFLLEFYAYDSDGNRCAYFKEIWFSAVDKAYIRITASPSFSDSYAIEREFYFAASDIGNTGGADIYLIRNDTAENFVYYIADIKALYLLLDKGGSLLFAYDGSMGKVVNPDNPAYGSKEFDILGFDRVTMPAGAFLVVCRESQAGYYGGSGLIGKLNAALAPVYNKALMIFFEDSQLTVYENRLPYFYAYSDLYISGAAKLLASVDFLSGVEIYDDAGVFGGSYRVSSGNISICLGEDAVRDGYLTEGRHTVTIQVTDDAGGGVALLYRVCYVSVTPPDNRAAYADGGQERFIDLSGIVFYNSATEDGAGNVSVYSADYWNKKSPVSPCYGGVCVIADGAGRVIRYIYAEKVYDADHPYGYSVEYSDLVPMARKFTLSEGEYIIFFQPDNIAETMLFAENMCKVFYSDFDSTKMSLKAYSLGLDIG